MSIVCSEFRSRPLAGTTPKNAPLLHCALGVFMSVHSDKYVAGGEQVEGVECPY